MMKLKVPHKYLIRVLLLFKKYINTFRRSFKMVNLWHDNLKPHPAMIECFMAEIYIF